MKKKNNILKKLQKAKKKKITIKDRILLISLALGTILFVFFILYIIWMNYGQRSVAYYLPTDKTVAFIEFKDLSLPSKMQDASSISKIEIETALKEMIGTDDVSTITKLTNNNVGIALIENKKLLNIPILFAKTNSRKKTLEFFESLTLPDETLVKSGSLRLPIYSYPSGQSFHFAFIGSFIFISSEIEPLELIKNTFELKESSISEQDDYKKSISNLPKYSWAKLYINFKAINSNDIALSSVVEPLKYAIDHFAMTIKKTQNGFKFNTFLNLNKNLLPLGKNYHDQSKFAYKLTDLVSSKNLALYIGGANLSDEWENTLNTISNLNPAYGLILESLIRAQVNNVFGEEISLRNDIYPLLEGEYALSIGTENVENLDFSLVLSHNNKEFAKTKLKKLMKGFRFLAAKFSPKLQIVTLPDGTESRELVSDANKLSESNEEYEGYNVNCLEIKGVNSGFCYTVLDNLLVITNKKETAINIINLSISPEFVLSQYQPFRQTISNLSKINDEITFIDIQKIIPLIINNKYGLIISPFLNKLDATSWVKHYFDDGVSTEGFVLIK